MRQWTGSALVQIMTCRLFGAKPFSTPMLGYCQLDSWTIGNKLQWNFDQNTTLFIHENASENIVCAEMCSERDSPLKRLYRRTHAKLTRLAGSGQLVWAHGCEFSLALVHARRPAWPGETSETILRVAPHRKTRPPDHTRVNWSVDASASGSAQVGSGGRHRWAARVQVGREPARQKAREGYPSHYTSLVCEMAVMLSTISRSKDTWLRRYPNRHKFRMAIFSSGPKIFKIAYQDAVDNSWKYLLHLFHWSF